MKAPLVLTLLLCGFMASAQNFKVVGYLAMWDFDTSCTAKIQWDRLTHINLAFANPDANGDLHIDGPDPAPLVNAAHQHGVKVFISLAGGYLLPEWETAWNYWMEPQYRGAYIAKILQFVAAHDLDGVDIDLEWQYVTNAYSPFVLALKDSLENVGLPMTAALPGSYRYPQITNEALAAYDWVNLMIYDLTGPWASNMPGQHSPFDWTQQCLQYWTGEGLPGSRQTLGLPFYGYDFATNPAGGFGYGEIVAMNPANALVDQVGQLYYNGIPTIIAKTQLALDQTSGVMIWELGQDAYDDLSEYSLLTTIDHTIHPLDAGRPPSVFPLRLFPNPASDYLEIEQLSLQNTFAQVLDLQGKTMWEGNLDNKVRVNLKGLPGGMYIVRLQSEGQTWVRKFVKI